MKISIAAVAACLLAPMVGHATTIVSAVSATASSERTALGASRTVDQSGLSVGYVSGVMDFDTYLGGNPTHTLVAAMNEWFSGFGNLTATLTFDLGSVLTIDRIALWVEETSGFSAAALSSSTDGASFASLGTVNPANPPRDFDYPAEVFGFAATPMQFFRMDLSGCPQPGTFTTNECSLGEIAFSSVDAGIPPIPVPASAMLLGSVLAGGLAFARRTRRSR